MDDDDSPITLLKGTPLQIVGVSLLSLGVLVYAAHIAWQQVQRLAYLHRLDRWGEPARTSEDEWSQDIPEWR